MGLYKHNKSLLGRASARAKLLGSFLIVSGILSAACIVALVKMAAINEKLSGLYERELVGLSSCKQAVIDMTKTQCAVRDVVISPEQDVMVQKDEQCHELMKSCEANLQIVKDTTKDAQILSLHDQAESAVAAYRQAAEQVNDLCLEGDKTKAREVMLDSREIVLTVNDVLNKLCERKEALAQVAYKSGQEAYSFAVRVVTGTIVAGAIVSMLLGWRISRWFTTALLEVDSIAQTLSAASEQLASAAEELSSGAQEQASSLEETAASLEEITGTVQQNADNAVQANQLSSGARDVAQKGGDVTHRAVAGMSEINEASNKIAAIITTIDEIAFQTNLLALNAAVEAARAGEQGRGFAVVAGEVRNLAQRSAGAAKEIKTLIQDSVGKVEAGSALVNQSGQTLDEIVNSVKRVTDIVAEIAAASREQATGIEQVNRAITQMDHVTQSNASQTEELSSTAESLAAQARHLQEVVDQFHLTKKDAAAGGRTPSSKVAANRPSRTTSAKARPQEHPAFGWDNRMEEPELVTVGTASGELGDFEEF